MKEKVIGFVWQHVLLLVSLFVMTLGVAMCVRSALGSSVISTIPFVMTLAGAAGEAPAWTIGEYTYVMNGVLVGLQILLLRRKFQAVQLFQLVIGFVFGFLLDVNMSLTAMFVPATLPWQMAAQAAGCTVLAVGIAMELRCGSVTMPGEGLPVAISRVTGKPFARVKIFVDVALVVMAVALGYVYFGAWLFNVVGTGTLFAMIYVGMAVKFFQPRMGWMDRLLCYRPGFRRYIYGLARYIYRRTH
ncbi:MAG: hypothetical protein HDS56_04280 [Barnesiella sp.]|nr:hypothetical protein [Barnesiella sp.]MBD5254230.1 hypothetical protein [Barnesiella sp.]